MKHHLQRNYRQAMVAIFLSAGQQFCGHANVLNFAPDIFAQAGFMPTSSLASTIVLGVVKFLVTVFVIVNVDKIGRRKLLLFGMMVMCASLLMMIRAFYLLDHSSGGGGTGTGGGVTSVNGVFAILGAVGMATGYAASFGPLTWLVTSEMFSSSIRGRALGASTIVTYLCGAVVSYTFLSVQKKYGLAMPFVLYFVVTVGMVGFAVLAIPDTGGKSPVAILAEMKTMKLWRWVSRSSSGATGSDAEGKEESVIDGGSGEEFGEEDGLMGRAELLSSASSDEVGGTGALNKVNRGSDSLKIV